MATRADICAAALTWQWTPYHHGAYLKEVGCDCIGLLIGVAREVGILPESWRPCVYSPQWHVHRNEELLRETLHTLGAPCLPLAERLPGHILLFKFGKVCSHAAILLPEHRIIHAVRSVRRVVVTTLTGDWLLRLQAVYAFPPEVQ